MTIIEWKISNVTPIPCIQSISKFCILKCIVCEDHRVKLVCISRAATTANEIVQIEKSHDTSWQEFQLDFFMVPVTVYTQTKLTLYIMQILLSIICLLSKINAVLIITHFDRMKSQTRPPPPSLTNYKTRVIEC